MTPDRETPRAEGRTELPPGVSERLQAIAEEIRACGAGTSVATYYGAMLDAITAYTSALQPAVTPASDEVAWLVVKAAFSQGTFSAMAAVGQIKPGADEWKQYSDEAQTNLNAVLSAFSALEHEIATLKARVEVAEAERDGFGDDLNRIHDFAHDHSTGPAVPDAFWDIRSMASTSDRAGGR